MCEAGILDSDQVVIQQRNDARNGEIVVALVRGKEITLKRISQEPGWDYPASTELPSRRGSATSPRDCPQSWRIVRTCYRASCGSCSLGSEST